MILDIVSSGLLVIGALLFAIASVGLHQYRDLYSRMHASTKPATLGLLSILAAAALQMTSAGDVAKLVLIALFQLATAPVAAHLIGRAAYRGRVPVDLADGIDDLDAYNRRLAEMHRAAQDAAASDD